MATFPGFTVAISSAIGLPDDNQSIASRDTQQKVTGLNGGPSPEAGAFTDTQPVDLHSDVLSGFKTRSFFEDFYNTIHFIPAIVELGAVSSDTSVPLIIWNAYLYPVALEQITFINQGGITLDGSAVPLSMVPLQTLEYRVEASSEGPPNIDALISFQFDTGTFEIVVTGTRARVSPIIPNWSDSFEIEYQFKTDIFTSRNGKEQRRALRQGHRKNVSFTATPTHDKLRKARNILAGWHSNTIIFPELPRQATLRQAAENTDFLYFRDQAPAWMQVGQTVVLANRGLYESREIAGVAGDSIQLSGTVPGYWPAGTKVHPGLAVRFADSISVRHLTAEAATIGVNLEVIPTSEPILPTAIPQSFRGREVWMRPPNWIDPVTDSFVSQRETVDYGRGKTAVFLPIPFGTVLQKMSYTGRNFQQAYDLVEFFIRCKGQLREFYMPTFLNDVQIGYEVVTGSRILRIPGTDFFRDLEGDTQRKAVAIFMKNGDVFLRGVNSVSQVSDDNGQDSALDLDEQLPYPLTLTNVDKISWLPVWRMASDTFTMEWVTNSVAQCQLSVRMLEDLPL